MRSALLLIACGLALALCAASAGAVPQQEGVLRALDASASVIDLARTGVVWRREIETRSESQFFRLHLAEIRLPSNADFVLRIHARNDELLLTVSSAELASRSGYWTSYLSGTYALIEIENRRARSGSLSIRIAEIGEEARVAKPLSAQDKLNRKDLPLRFFAEQPGVMAAARSVAKLGFTKGRLMLSCTGFLVAPDLLLTNQHCFDAAAECESAVAIFGYEQDAELNDRVGEEQRCLKVEAFDAGLDFSLIRLSGSPGNRWGVLHWSVAPLHVDEALYVVQHPAGRPKRVALNGCQLSHVLVVGRLANQPTDLGHVCDTGEGSSGSPVLDLHNQVVGLHHLGFSDTDSNWSRENRAVRASFILDRISSFIH